MSETIKEKIQAPYRFNEQETCELARKLAQSNQRMAELEGQKKSAMSDFKARAERDAALSQVEEWVREHRAQWTEITRDTVRLPVPRVEITEGGILQLIEHSPRPGLCAAQFMRLTIPEPETKNRTPWAETAAAQHGNQHPNNHQTVEPGCPFL